MIWLANSRQVLLEVINKVSLLWMREAAIFPIYFLASRFVFLRRAKGLTFSTDLDMTLIRACRKNCNKLVVLADHTKFGMTYYFKTLSIKEIDIIITDQEPEEKWRTYCEENGITLIY